MHFKYLVYSCVDNHHIGVVQCIESLEVNKVATKMYATLEAPTLIQTINLLWLINIYNVFITVYNSVYCLGQSPKMENLMCFFIWQI